VYSTVIILGLSLNFGQFNKPFAAKLCSLPGKPQNPISNLSSTQESVLIRVIRGFCVKIGKILVKNQSKARVPSSKNQIFWKIFNCLSDIDLW